MARPEKKERTLSDRIREFVEELEEKVADLLRPPLQPVPVTVPVMVDPRRRR
jgi:hypothetical protein